MGDIVKYSGPYLFPFVIEYSLIAAAVLFAMWKNIGKNPRYFNFCNKTDEPTVKIDAIVPLHVKYY